MFTTTNITYGFHQNPCFKSGCEPQQRALAAPKHPKPSCLFKCARVNQFLNQCAPALLISFPHTHHFSIFSIIILLPFSYPHIILNINLISFPQRQHFSKSSSSTTHSQICIGPKGDSFLGDLRNIDIFNYKNYDLEIHIEYFANSATFA